MSEATSQSFAAHAADADWEEGLRSYMSYRGLGIKEATNGKVMAHIIRATEPCEGPMGYHYHDLEFQLNYLIKGSARVYLGRHRRDSGSKREMFGIRRPTSNTKCWSIRMTLKCWKSPCPRISRPTRSRGSVL